MQGLLTLLTFLSPFITTQKIIFKLHKLIIHLKHVIPRYSTMFHILLKYLRFSLAISPIFTIFVPSN